MIEIFLYLQIVFILNFIIKKKNIILSHSGSFHQQFVNQSIPLTGGLFLSIPIIFCFLFKNDILLTFYISILFLGITSDLNILSSPRKRFLIQIFIIFLFVFLNKLEVLPSKIEFIDNAFSNTYWSYLFTIFCIVILINGSNFIDGLNGLLLGYFLIILFIIYKLNLTGALNLASIDNSLVLIISCFFIIYFFNLFNQLFLGDSGAYSISFIIGYILIDIYNFYTPSISPYFIILLVWYPCFENLFSIIRKLFKKKSPFSPDNEHLHQYLYIFIKNKFKTKSLTSNVCSGLVINSFNFFVLYLSSTNINHTYFQLKLIFFVVTIYILTYFFIRKIVKKS